MAKRSQRKKGGTTPALPPASRPKLTGKSFPWKTLLPAAIIILATFWIYGPALHGAWLWDDDVDITNNPNVLSPSGLSAIWLDPAQSHAYYPITFSVEWLEWQLWGANTLGYHL